MKVKIFRDFNSEDIQKDINDFIKDKKIIDIKYAVTTDAYNGQCYCEVLVVYEEPTKLKQETFYMSDDAEVNDFISKHDVVNVEHFGNGDEINTIITYREQ
ncbi:sporulation protein Cse60 [uncultured Lactobacillus sp.]|uniref:sporulation protein Cse60 n=1 Tax=uncultured Lactobacillus sp. TaxID=153152 RepID=UPI00262A4D72|nr:sporulation protein Cse60 [uncultured Lactobacillus sp.]